MNDAMLERQMEAEQFPPVIPEWGDPETQGPETITTADGFVVDMETGEIVGQVDVRPAFVVDDSASADWVLEKMQDVDALVFMEEAKLRAITECIQSRITAQRRRRDWLQRRFAAELEHYAAGALAGVKGRTLVLDHGKISFRKSAGSIKVGNMLAAVEWCKSFAPDAVKVTESVVVTPLKALANLPPEIFEVTGPGEKCTIETGIKAERAA